MPHCQEVFISKEKRKFKPFDVKLSDPTERSCHQGASLTGGHCVVVLSETLHGLQQSENYSKTQCSGPGLGLWKTA